VIQESAITVQSASIWKAEQDDIDALVLGTYKRWSSSAVECYLRKAECEGCYYQQFFASKPYECKMKFAVEQLLEAYGEPRAQLVDRCPPAEAVLVD
jgi:hypothetical protein